MESMDVCGREFRVLKLLGRGKGGYSYLVTDGEGQYVLKQIHHEPCSYYTFGDKLRSELRDYGRLRAIGVPMPRMLAADVEKERILKEYVEGDTVFDLVRRDEMKPEYVEQMRALCEKLYAANINIDYFPTNLIVSGGKLVYVDYECNGYLEQWDFEHWGIRYWSKTPEFLQYLEETNTV